MAHRFGKSHWQDADRLNLMKVCLEFQQWDERLQAMRGIYSKLNYPPGYFTENSCREELERIMSLPTPNLRIDVSETFVYSRKIMMGKWIDYFDAEVRKERSSQLELGMVDLRKNFDILKEAMDPKTSPKRLDEITELLEQNADRHKTDGEYKRLIGSLDTAIFDRFEDEGSLDLDALTLPPSKPPPDDHDFSTKGYLTPAHPSQDFDMSFFSPPPPPFVMRTLADALREAAPVTDPEPTAEATTSIENTLPDDFLEPSPTKEPKTEEIEEMEVEEQPAPSETVAENPAPAPSSSRKEVAPESAKAAVPESSKPDVPDSPKSVVPGSPKSVVPESPKHASKPPTPAKPVSKTSQKKKEPSPLPINIDDIKEEAAATPPPMPEPALPPPAPTPRGRGRPRLQSNSISSPASKKVERATTPRDETPEVPAKRRHQERSQEPSTSTQRKPRAATSNSRKKKEDTPSSTVSSVTFMTRSESGLDFQGILDSLNDSPTQEIGTQTEINIKHLVLYDRAIAPPPRGSSKGRSRKSQAAGEVARSVSRNSSTSTPQPRGDSVTRNPLRSIGVQTNARMDIDKDDEVIVSIDPRPTYHTPIVDLDNRRANKINLDTCKEIAAENAAAEKNIDAVKRPAKTDSRREFSMFIDADSYTGKRLISERSFEAVPDALYTTAFKRRRDVLPREDPVKTKLFTMFRAIYDCEWSEPFRRPVSALEGGYDKGILERIDLSMIKREIDNGDTQNVTRFLLRAYRMLSNAVMFNGFDHDVHIYAKNICKQVMSGITGITIDDYGLDISKRREDLADNRPTSSSGSSSVESEPAKVPRSGSLKRVVSRKNPSTEGIMTVHGNRKAKRKT